MSDLVFLKKKVFIRHTQCFNIVHMTWASVKLNKPCHNNIIFLITQSPGLGFYESQCESCEMFSCYTQSFTTKVMWKYLNITIYCNILSLVWLSMIDRNHFYLHMFTINCSNHCELFFSKSSAEFAGVEGKIVKDRFWKKNSTID